MLSLYCAATFALALQSTQPCGLRALALADALELAAAEHKIVLASFQVAWDPASIELDRGTWTHPRLRLLLDARTVAIRVDAEREAALAERFAVDSLPTVVLLRPTGDAFDRIIGFRRPQEMQAELEAALAGKDAVQRARDEFERTGGRSPVARERLGDALAFAGQPEAALAEYVWCFDEGLRLHVLYASTRRAGLAAAIRRLAESHPPALEVLRTRRDARAAALQTGDDAAATAYELAALNDALDEPDETLRVYDRLPATSRARGVLYRSVFDRLITARRYAEVLTAGDPLDEFSEAVRVARLRSTPCCAVHYRGGRFIGETVVERGAKLLEALAGVQRIEEAQRLIDLILAYQDSPEHRELLSGHLRRAGAAALADSLAARPAPQP